jgi:hypothetical protein
MSHDPGESQGSDLIVTLGQGQEGDAVADHPPQEEVAFVSTTPTTPIGGFGSEVDSQLGEHELEDYNDRVAGNQPAPGMGQSPQSVALPNPALPLEDSPSESLQTGTLVVTSATEVLPADSLEGLPQQGAPPAEARNPTAEVVSTIETTSVLGSCPPPETVSQNETAPAGTSNPQQDLASQGGTRPSAGTVSLEPAASRSEAAAPEVAAAPLIAIPQSGIAPVEHSVASSQREPASERSRVPGWENQPAIRASPLIAIPQPGIAPVEHSVASSQREPASERSQVQTAFQAELERLDETEKLWIGVPPNPQLSLPDRQEIINLRHQYLVKRGDNSYTDPELPSRTSDQFQEIMRARTPPCHLFHTVSKEYVMARPQDLLPLIKGNDLFLSLLAPAPKDDLGWSVERGLISLALDKLVQTRLCPERDSMEQNMVPFLFDAAMAESAMTRASMRGTTALAQIMFRHDDVSRHMSDRLSLEHLLSEIDVERHFPPSTGPLDPAHASRVGHVMGLKKSLREFQAKPLVELVLNSRLAETREIVADLVQSVTASQISVRNTFDACLRREEQARLTVHLYTMSMENDRFLSEHHASQTADLRSALKTSEEINLVNLQLVKQLKEQVNDLSTKLRAVPPGLIGFISQFDRRSLDGKHLRKEVVRYEFPGKRRSQVALTSRKSAKRLFKEVSNQK